MPQERYRHIFLLGPTRTQGFTSPRKGGNAPRFPTRDRYKHSEFLQHRFNEAWDQAEHRYVVSQTLRHGTYLQFISDPGFDLTLQSLENIRSGIRLLNVQYQGEPENQETKATVYVPNNRRTYFLKKIRDYAEKESKNNKPKNANLVDSIADICSAVLQSFWQDTSTPLPGDDPAGVEVWISSRDDAVISRFNEMLSQFNIPILEGILKFPERSVEVISANRNNLEKLIQSSDDIAEFRAVYPLASYFIEIGNKEQIDIVGALVKRLEITPDTDIVVCILDTGVNNGHLLIKPILDNSDLHTARASWGTDDHSNHGTLMAGIAAYGDLLALISSNDTIRIMHRLESAKIVPPRPEQNPKELWGYLTAQGLSRAEIQAPKRKRITALAITSDEDRNRGRPSSWSAMIDSLTSGYDDDRFRLIIISAGNVDEAHAWANYPTDNLTNEIHDPGQAWNALTVGAFTRKVQIKDPTLQGFMPIASAGGLSPYSTTSYTWISRQWPIKPDFVLEGGNVARGPNDSVLAADELQLISTNDNPQEAQFSIFCATSAASAQAAWMAAQIQARYPDAWPETIRALMVHTAEWTEEMIAQFLPSFPSKLDYSKLLRICGYGVPNLDNALYCLSNSLTLISQAYLQPFDKRHEQYVTREMHLYRLPWPKDVLSYLGEMPIQMRVTLSYFVEPGPGEIGWENKYRYASHGLRFEVNGPSESENNFIRRVNAQARDDGQRPDSAGPTEKWMIGSQARNVGSIHSDIWQGTAADLAASNIIAIYPTVGWWRDRHNQNRWHKKCRYALIVSIRTSRPDIDIYTPVALQVGLPITIEIQTT